MTGDLHRVRRDAAEAAATGLVRVERGQLRLARCVSEIAVTVDVVDRLLPGGLVVVLTAGQGLVDHVAARWNRVHPDADYLLTGSHHGTGGLPRAALFATSPDVIAAWVAADTAGLRVLIGQHRHADLVGEGLLKAGGWADLLVVHEAQHTAGYAKRRAAVHDDKALPAAARLYTTAAPRVFRRPGTPPADPDEVALSMDEEEVFGPVLHEYPAEQAIADGAAARVRLRLGTPDVVAPHAFCIHRDSRRTIKVTLAEALTGGDTGAGSPCCAAADIAFALTRTGTSTSDVTATIRPVDGVAEVVRTHAGLRHVLRALRDWDPAFGGALDAARAHGHHADLLRWVTVEPHCDDVLAALAESGAHDWWVGYGHLARTGSPVVPIGHEVDGFPLGQWLNSTRSTYVRQGLPLDRYEALRVLGATTGNQHDVNRQRRWEQHFATATAFHARYGHLDVELPGTEAPKEFRSWVSAVRRGRWPVTAAMRAALDALGMSWDPPPLLRRKAVAAAFAAHGSLDFPDDLTVEVRGERTRLANWVAVFREEHRLGTLHPDVRRVLRDAGFVFDPDERGRVTATRRRLSGRQSGSSEWDEVFAVVKRFHDEHGHLDVPAGLRAGGGTLVRPWLNNQRRRLRAGTTTQRQKEELDSVGFVWDAEEAEWMAKYRLACRFHREHGYLAVTKTHVRENREWAPLTNWLRNQVKLRAAQRLGEDRVALLDRIGMPWVEQPGREHRWEQRLRQLDTFRRTHGHTHIHAQLSRTTDAGAREELKKLAAWLNDQLVYARRGTLRADRREKLTAIGMAVPAPRPPRHP